MINQIKKRLKKHSKLIIICFILFLYVSNYSARASRAGTLEESKKIPLSLPLWAFVVLAGLSLLWDDNKMIDKLWKLNILLFVVSILTIMAGG
jgi:hypothetical protein